MLARVADSLYWMNRYLERVEYIARLIGLQLERLPSSPARDIACGLVEPQPASTCACRKSRSTMSGGATPPCCIGTSSKPCNSSTAFAQALCVRTQDGTSWASGVSSSASSSLALFSKRTVPLLKILPREKATGSAFCGPAMLLKPIVNCTVPRSGKKRCWTFWDMMPGCPMRCVLQ